MRATKINVWMWKRVCGKYSLHPCVIWHSVTLNIAIKLSRVRENKLERAIKILRHVYVKKKRERKERNTVGSRIFNYTQKKRTVSRREWKTDKNRAFRQSFLEGNLPELGHVRRKWTSRELEVLAPLRRRWNSCEEERENTSPVLLRSSWKY